MRKFITGVCPYCIVKYKIDIPQVTRIIHGRCKHCGEEKKVHTWAERNDVAALIVIAVLALIVGACASGCVTVEQINREIDRANDRIDGPASAEDVTPSVDTSDTPIAPLPPAPVANHVINRIPHWYGPNLSGATVDERFALTVRDDGRTWSSAPADWRAGRAGAGCPGDCTTMICMAYQRSDGSWVGGKFDWNRTPSSRRDWANVANGYNGWQAPPVGADVICWAYTDDGRRVSKEAITTYRP